MEIAKANLWEIKKSGSLRTLGGLLALFHSLQFYLWFEQGHLPLKLVQQDVPMCWALFETCDWMRIFPLGVFSFIYYSYAVFVGLAAFLFLLTSLVGLAYYLLLFGLLFGMSLYFQDLRLSSNEGYFIFFATFAYLFVPAKHRLMRWLVMSFFAARGLSQASPDWLTGNWYMEHLALPVKLAEWLAAVSVIVQMIGGMALIFRDGRYFWSGWIGLFFFECTHLYIGEMFSSSLAMGALLYVAFDELELRKAEREYVYQSFIRPEPSFVFGGILLAFFWCAQLTPFFGLERDSRLKSVLDVWALHPEAAHEECEQRTFARYKDRTEEVAVDSQMSRQPAMLCNPYLRFLDLKAACKAKKDEDPNFVTFSSVLQVRNYREKSTYRAFEVKDFCDPELTFKKLGEVKWTTNPAM
ncbi:MAG TPA: hypothetical protein PKC28_08805 [Bdellovibrionales bacterium]|nr:hypothetical protein [Bdellovibrionales bacterium]